MDAPVQTDRSQFTAIFGLDTTRTCVSLAEPVRIAGVRGANEETFQTSKGDTAMDHYQVQQIHRLVPAHHPFHVRPSLPDPDPLQKRGPAAGRELIRSPRRRSGGCWSRWSGTGPLARNKSWNIQPGEENTNSAPEIVTTKPADIPTNATVIVSLAGMHRLNFDQGAVKVA